MHLLVIGGVAAGTKAAAKYKRLDRAAQVTVLVTLVLAGTQAAAYEYGQKRHALGQAAGQEGTQV